MRPFWLLLTAFSSLQLFTQTWQFTLIPEPGGLAREPEISDKGYQWGCFQRCLVTCSLSFSRPPEALSSFSFFRFLIPSWTPYIYFFFPTCHTHTSCFLYCNFVLLSWASREGWLRRGRGGFSWCFCKIKHGANLKFSGWRESMDSRTFYPRKPMGEEGNFSAGCSFKGGCHSPCLGVLTWSLTRDALRAHSSLDTVHEKQNSSVRVWEEGREEGKRELKL